MRKCGIIRSILCDFVIHNILYFRIRWLFCAILCYFTDAWYIHLLAGDLKLARRLAADIAPLEWFCFHRGRRDGRPHLLNRAYVLPAPNNRKEK